MFRNIFQVVIGLFLWYYSGRFPSARLGMEKQMRAFALVPLFVLIAGCSGGGGGVHSPNSNPSNPPVVVPPVVPPVTPPVVPPVDPPIDPPPVTPPPVIPPVVVPPIKVWTLTGMAEFGPVVSHPAVMLARLDDEGNLVGVVYAEAIVKPAEMTETTALPFALEIKEDTPTGVYHLVTFNDDGDSKFSQAELVGDWEYQLQIADGKISVIDPFGDVVTGGEDATKYGSIAVVAQYEQ